MISATFRVGLDNNEWALISNHGVISDFKFPLLIPGRNVSWRFWLYFITMLQLILHITLGMSVRLTKSSNTISLTVLPCLVVD